MAILRFGTLIVGARGTIGGITLSANKAGPYGKPWAAPPRTVTPTQAAARAPFGALKYAWRALHPSQRQDWNTFAADPAQEKTNSLGEPYYLNGWQWFVAFQGWRSQPYRVKYPAAPVIAPALIENAPMGGPAAAPTITSLSAGAGDPPSVELAWSAPALGSAEYLTIEAMPIYSPAQDYIPAALPAVAVITDADSSPFDLSAPIAAAFGTLVPNTQLALRAYYLPSDGYRSAAAVELAEVS